MALGYRRESFSLHRRFFNIAESRKPRTKAEAQSQEPKAKSQRPPHGLTRRDASSILTLSSRAALYQRHIACPLCGRLAQLVRAPALQAGGRRFESCTAHHSIRSPALGSLPRRPAVNLRGFTATTGIYPQLLTTVADS